MGEVIVLLIIILLCLSIPCMCAGGYMINKNAKKQFRESYIGDTVEGSIKNLKQILKGLWIRENKLEKSLKEYIRPLYLSRAEVSTGIVPFFAVIDKYKESAVERPADELRDVHYKIRSYTRALTRCEVKLIFNKEKLCHI